MSGHSPILPLTVVSALALLLSFAHFSINVWHSRPATPRTVRLLRLLRFLCVACLATGACLEFVECFRAGSVSSGLCGLFWVAATVVWLRPEQPSDDDELGSDDE